MTPADRTAYIVACIRDAGAMYPQDAAEFLAQHDADALRTVLERLEQAAGESAVELLLAHNPDLAETAAQTETAKSPAPDFFRPGRTYTSASRSATFRCVTLDSHPNTGETRAIGWYCRSEKNWFTVATLDPDDWGLDGWTETTEDGGR